ncbi:hypothetical protein HanIR_Chr01g0003251 [Helianthus annuus]|nr:hypothetical protein HanIR_Chr01g0003251 [Helianthus annuus]
MSTFTKPVGSKKRHSRPKDPLGPDCAIINWKEEEFHNLCQRFKFTREWGAQFPTAGSTALNTPPGYMTLYAAFFREGNFRLPMTKFFGEIFTRYSLHISKINALGLPRVTHFEFICRAQKLVPSVEMFNMHYRAESEGVPKVVIGGSYADQEWYKTLTRIPTAMLQLEEKALVVAGMSLMWVPKHPKAAPIYSYMGKGYSLMNALDSEVGGEMVSKVLQEGEKSWVDRIRDNFLHPSSKTLNTYIATPLGARLPASTKPEVGKSPAREEAILLLSEESTGSSHGLIHRSTRVDPRARPVQASRGDAASKPPTVHLAILSLYCTSLTHVMNI